MAKKCKTVSQLKAEILKQVQQGMKEKVSEVVKDEEVEQIDRVVYDAYEPKIYERRHDNDGLADKDNMISDVSTDSDEITLMVTNQTRGNLEYGSNEVFIAPIVEHGHGSQYGDYDYGTGKEPYSKPRRFQKATMESLKDNKKHVEALKGYLVQCGLKVK